MTRKYLRGLAWGFYFLGAVLLAATFMPGLALGSSPSAPQQGPALYVGQVKCHDKLYVLFPFQLRNWPGGQPPGATSFTVNGNGYTAPLWKQGGGTVNYLGLVPVNGSQQYDLTAAHAGNYNLQNPGSFNVPCGNAPTTTPTTEPPTVTPTTEPPTNTPTPTQPSGGPTNTPTQPSGGGGGGGGTDTPVALVTAVSTPVALAPTTGQELALGAVSRLQLLGSLAVGLILMGLALQWASGRLNRAS